MRISDWSSDVCSSDLRLLISGVARAVKPKELAAEYGRPHKLFDCCIALGFEAEDTRSNATEVASWVARRNYKTVRLVTTDWHMRRAEYEIGRAIGKGVTIVPDAGRCEPSFGTLFPTGSAPWREKGGQYV